MKEQIPVNPDLLVWARETAGLSLEETAQRMNKSVEIIELWEKGDGAPTYIQLEKLAYQIYKRPLALFFFPEPPQEETPNQSFRTLPEQEIKMMSSRMKILIRKARVMQANLIELNQEINPAEKQIFKELSFDVNQPLVEMTKTVRELLGISLDRQIAWKDTDDAFKCWREQLEENGIFIFKDAFKDDDFSGFCLYNDEFPLIYINNSKSNTRQIFTLFHELAHILFKTGGVDTRLNNYINYIEGDDRKIEIICNRFAGQFLVPDLDFNNQIAGVTVNDEILQDIADRYKVSREVILRKFLDRNIIDQTYYYEKTSEWAESAKAQKGAGGDYYRNMGIYLSQKYLEIAFSHFYQKRISDSQLADYLGVKAKSIPGMENIMMSKGTYV
jgi:Zn-dependent peptidase ImmA (M78 family)